jgi:AcrR family transcriptional regulator
LVENLTGTKEKILKATLELINSEGLRKVTVRKIAALADVNIAAINYHFGSKERVIDASLGYLTDRFEVAFAQLQDSSQPVEIRFYHFLLKFYDTAVLYPELVKRFITQNMNRGLSVKASNAMSMYATFIERGWVVLLLDTVRVLRPNDDDATLAMHILQVMSALIFPIVLDPVFSLPMGLQFSDEEMRQRYIKLLVDMIVNQ